MHHKIYEEIFQMDVIKGYYDTGLVDGEKNFFTRIHFQRKT